MTICVVLSFKQSFHDGLNPKPNYSGQVRRLVLLLRDMKTIGDCTSGEKVMLVVGSRVLVVAQLTPGP